MTETTTPERPTPEPRPLERIVQNYGDLLFDLCESVLWSPVNAQLAFRAILKRIKSETSDPGALYEENQRGWVLRVACRHLTRFARRNARKVTPSEQIQVDSSQNVSMRLKQFDFYFHRLFVEDQILLLLRDKYGLPYPEIAAALGIPEGTLKIRRQQALRTLEEWLWETS